MPSYDIALVVTIEADKYLTALREATHLAEGIGMTDEISCSAVTYYDQDNYGQRVLYLHPVDEPIFLPEPHRLSPEQKENL